MRIRNTDREQKSSEGRQMSANIRIRNTDREQKSSEGKTRQKFEKKR
jgi:putative lipoic acid-binding regulatory protein